MLLHLRHACPPVVEAAGSSEGLVMTGLSSGARARRTDAVLHAPTHSRLPLRDGQALPPTLGR